MKTLRIAVLLAFVGLLSSITHAQGCSNLKLKGDFGFAGTGLVPEKLQNATFRFDPIAQVAVGAT